MSGVWIRLLVFGGGGRVFGVGFEDVGRFWLGFGFGGVV